MMPDWFKLEVIPPNILLAALVIGSVLMFLGILAVWFALRRQNSQARSLEEDLTDLKGFLQEQQESSARTIEATSSGIDGLKTSLQEQSRILESLRASSKISEHWDALEKFIVFNEQLDRMSRDISLAFSALIDEVKSQQSERVRLAQNQFKTQMDQSRKALEKTIAGKLVGTMPRAQLDQLTATVIDSIRYSMLSVGKLHQDNLNGFARVLFEDVELKVQNGVRNTFYKIEDLKQKIEQFTELLGSTPETDPEAEPEAPPSGNGAVSVASASAVAEASVAPAVQPAIPAAVPDSVEDATGDAAVIRREEAGQVEVSVEAGVPAIESTPDEGRLTATEIIPEPVRNREAEGGVGVT